MKSEKQAPDGKVPREIALGDGLSLRVLSPDDARTIYETVEANRTHLDTWLPWVEATREAGDTQRFLGEVEKKAAEGMTLAYSIWEGAAFRGIIGMHDINAANGNLQIGYWLEEAAQGRGLMTKATRAVVGVAFEALGMERIEVRCAVGNEKSSGVPERLGFRYEGVARRAQKLHGRFVDVNVYSLLREEWASIAQDI